MKKNIYFLAKIISASVFLAAAVSCSSSPQATLADATPKNPAGVKTYVNTGVNNATGNISTILLFNEITEVVGIHPTTRQRFELSASNYNYNKNTTELKINLPASVPYKLTDLSYHIVGYAADPGIFVLSGIDPKNNKIGVFFEGKKAVEGTDYSYDKSANQLKSLVPLNVDADSFQICWATKNGFVNFSNNTQKYKDAYQKFYNEWARSVNLSN